MCCQNTSNSMLVCYLSIWRKLRFMIFYWRCSCLTLKKGTWLCRENLRWNLEIVSRKHPHNLHMCQTICPDVRLTTSMQDFTQPLNGATWTQSPLFSRLGLSRKRDPFGQSLWNSLVHCVIRPKTPNQVWQFSNRYLNSDQSSSFYPDRLPMIWNGLSPSL